MNRPNFILASLLALIPAGCSVGPNYHPPQSKVPPHWEELHAVNATETPAELASWWKRFEDPELDSLIERTTAANYDLKMATARLHAARALRGAVIADFLPTIGATASYTKARRSRNSLAFPVQLIDTDT